MDELKDQKLKNTLLDLTQSLAMVGGWSMTLGPDPEGFWTQGAFDIYEYDGITPPSLEEYNNLVKPQYRENLGEAIDLCIRESIPVDIEVEITTFKNNEKWLRIIGESQVDDNGVVESIAGAVQDITHLKIKEKENRDLSERLFNTLETMTDAFYMLDKNWDLLYINEAAANSVGKARNEDIYKNLWETFPTLKQTPLYDGFHHAVATQQVFQCEYFSYLIKRWLDITAYPSKEGLAIYFRDITEQKELEAATKLSTQRLNLLTQAMLDVAWDWDISNERLWWSKALESVYGYYLPHTDGEIISDLDFWSENIHPEDRERVLEFLNTTLQSEKTSLEVSYRFKHFDGRYLNVESRAYIIRNESGVAERMLGGMTDISERLELEERLRQSQRMESIGKLTGGVAHDFNNILTVILGNTELLLEEAKKNQAIEKSVRMIANSANRGAGLTDRLLMFSRQQPLEPRSININHIVESMHEMLRRTLDVNIKIDIVISPNLKLAKVDPHQLEGALLNLCINSRDAMDNEGVLSIETFNVTLDENFADTHTEVEPGEYVELVVSDTGKGIASENLKHIFDPFFTTKERGRGTGLGLSSVFGFLKQSKGHVSIYSELDVGTTVRVYIPVSTLPEDVIKPDLSEVLTGDENILIVEDDEMVRILLDTLLDSLGYTVSSAENGTAALALLKENKDFDLLLTDVNMPGMSGVELVKQSKEFYPDLKVLFTSGFTENAIFHHGQIDPDVFFLHKPYSRKELSVKIREVINSPETGA